jgi:hypothetical protein
LQKVCTRTHAHTTAAHTAPAEEDTEGVGVGRDDSNVEVAVLRLHHLRQPSSLSLAYVSAAYRLAYI